jgi:hypothetical protein
MRDGRPDAPVVVLTYAHAGVQHLLSHLVGRPDLACTAGTGVLPLCDQAVTTWWQAEGRLVGSGDGGGAGGPGGNGGPNGVGAPISPLAAASVRALASGMITAILARAGKRRWCETAVAFPGGAGTFLRLFPGTRFLCLHRSCPGVIRESLAASPWGLSGPAFAPFVAAYPSSTVAALAAYWAGYAGPLLDFEREHKESCCRVRHEDLMADPAGESARFTEFLDLDEAPGLPAPPPSPGPANGPATGEPPVPAQNDVPLQADLPVSQLPSALLAQVNELAARLGYPPLERAA